MRLVASFLLWNKINQFAPEISFFFYTFQYKVLKHWIRLQDLNGFYCNQVLFRATWPLPSYPFPLHLSDFPRFQIVKQFWPHIVAPSLTFHITSSLRQGGTSWFHLIGSLLFSSLVYLLPYSGQITLFTAHFHALYHLKSRYFTKSASLNHYSCWDSAP